MVKGSQELLKLTIVTIGHIVHIVVHPLFTLDVHWTSIGHAPQLLKMSNGHQWTQWTKFVHFL